MDKRMKNCILMTVYKDVSLINRIIARIPMDWDIFIHIDKKSPILIEQINDRAKVIKTRRVFWGSIEHVNAFLDLMKIANKSANYDYYHLITGQDYICRKLTDMYDILQGGGYIYAQYSSSSETFD